MPFKPFTKADADPTAPPAAPRFSKQKASKRRFGKKGGKAAPIQKSMMQANRAMGGGGR